MHVASRIVYIFVCGYMFSYPCERERESSSYRSLDHQSTDVTRSRARICYSPSIYYRHTRARFFARMLRCVSFRVYIRYCGDGDRYVYNGADRRRLLLPSRCGFCKMATVLYIYTCWNIAELFLCGAYIIPSLTYARVQRYIERSEMNNRKSVY